MAALPKSLLDLDRLEILDLSNCSGLPSLPEPAAKSGAVLQHLSTINLSQCGLLTRLPESLMQLSSLVHLNLSGCHALQCLPRLKDLTALQSLNISYCSSLAGLPSLPASLTGIDLSHCSSDNMAESLVKAYAELCKVRAGPIQVPSTLADVSELQDNQFVYTHHLGGLLTEPSCVQWQSVTLEHACSLRCNACCSTAGPVVLLQEAPAPAEALKVSLWGWSDLLGDVDYLMGSAGERVLYPRPLKGLIGKLRRGTIVQKLLEDAALARELLTRLSWLAILLATAAFTGAITPPAGCDNGRLFLPYNKVGNRSVGACLSRTSGQNVAEDARCPTTVQFNMLRAYSILVMLTFGVSIALVLLLVAFSIPTTRVVPHDRAALAGHVYDQLMFSTLLMVIAVGCGLGAITSALLAVYPVELIDDVWIPFAVSAAFMGLATCMLLGALLDMWPGFDAVLHPFADVQALCFWPVNLVLSQCNIAIEHIEHLCTSVPLPGLPRGLQHAMALWQSVYDSVKLRVSYSLNECVSVGLLRSCKAPRTSSVATRTRPPATV